MPKLLVTDDHEQIIAILSDYAKKEGYTVITAHDGEEALALFTSERPDAVLLDVMMPRRDGFAVCREIRRQSNVPIIMVTARGEDFEKIMGLDIGADDYILKPFSPGEVMARLRAVLRRLTAPAEISAAVFAYGNLRIDLESYTVTLNGESVPLTKKETEILWTLATNQGKVFSREHLLNSLWGYDYYGDSRTVDSHIKRLRAKLDTYGHSGWDIKTIWGIGYKFEADADV